MKKRQHMGRWLDRCNARVITYFTTRGVMVHYAHMNVPIGPYSSWPKMKKVDSPEEGQAWLFEQAHEWARKNNVEWMNV